MSILPFFVFVLYYGCGVFLLYLREKKAIYKNALFLQSAWFLFSITLYMSVLELLKGTAYFLFPVCFFLLFLWMYFKNRVRLANGLYFQVALIILGVYLFYTFYVTRDLLIGGLFILAFALFFILALFGVVSLITFLYWNSFVILRRESRSLANMLTLFLAILLTFYIVLSFLITRIDAWYVTKLYFYLSFVLFYFFSLLMIFLTTSLLYQFYRPSYTQDFIVVLGAGLINGERVTPLLAKRIDRAIAFSTTQMKKNGRKVTLVMSGGQGADEKIPEALAMKNYALEQGVKEEQILLEANSTTTFENMKFSKEVIDQQEKTSKKIIFSSNNYHLFRAAIYAKQAGLDADGIGAHTAFYYLPNAFLREFAAILMMHKKRHLFILGGAFFLLFLSTFFEFFIV